MIGQQRSVVARFTEKTWGLRFRSLTEALPRYLKAALRSSEQIFKLLQDVQLQAASIGSSRLFFGFHVAIIIVLWIPPYVCI